MKRLFLVTALLAALGACSNWHHRGSDSSSSNAPANSVNSQQGSYSNPSEAPATQGQTGVHTGSQPGESGYNNSSSTLGGGGGGR